MSQDEKQPSNKKGCLGSIVFIFVVALGMTIFNGSNDETTATKTDAAQEHQADSDAEYFISNNAKSYAILLERDLSHAARTRYSANIVSQDAITKEDFFGTAAKAAKDLQRKHRVQVAHVNILDADQRVVYSVNYAPDAKGWQGTESLGHRFVVD